MGRDHVIISFVEGWVIQQFSVTSHPKSNIFLGEDHQTPNVSLRSSRETFNFVVCTPEVPRLRVRALEGGADKERKQGE